MRKSSFCSISAFSNFSFSPSTSSSLSLISLFMPPFKESSSLSELESPFKNEEKKRLLNHYTRYARMALNRAINLNEYNGNNNWKFTCFFAFSINLFNFSFASFNSLHA